MERGREKERGRERGRQEEGVGEREARRGDGMEGERERGRGRVVRNVVIHKEDATESEDYKNNVPVVQH